MPSRKTQLIASLGVLFLSIAAYYLANLKTAVITTPTPPAQPSLDQVAMSRRATTGAIVALSHGGGPLPLLNDPSSAAMTASLRTRVPSILNLTSPDPARRPRAIILVTAHWVAKSPLSFPEITSSARPALIYDYYGFPPESYEFKYAAAGAPDLAARLAAVAAEHGLSPRLQPDRGWDHGVFVPLLLARPEADVPVLQVSVLGSDDARAHFRLGRALGDLQRREAEAGNGPVAIVGSGFASFHNLRIMLSGDGIIASDAFRTGHKAWNAAVTDAATTKDVQAREDKFAAWRTWPDAYVSHPPHGSEHFMPLAVCAGAAGQEEAKFYVDDYVGLDIHSYYWD
ncbi:hypothetical protein PpBr36_04791 [Pyricularia pennisetigena]|uniref:hypothetical protein n=1 Tax=Pyricularia pennisetigena TaxID=1578925 RepID=UPI00115094B7|nr:hypothetical protein PpBr36_04791 [Pyricularia pennisetigena]TLS26870.1 hypothetical protein PpBr36_04791 [Pyricularia pennisetigena]